MDENFSKDNVIDIRSIAFKIKEFLRNLHNKLWLFGIIFLGFIILMSTFYTIAPEELGVVLRLGKYSHITSPGLHFKIPFGIDNVYKVKTEMVYKQEFGFRTIESGVHTEYERTGYDDESLMLTGDLNVIDLEFVVQYRIKDPLQYLFKVADVEKAIRDVSEAVIRKITGNKTFDGILINRVEVADAAQQELQKILDLYETGIKIITIKLQDVNPPDPVKPAFNEVNEAIQDREQLVNQAQEKYNKEIPMSKGEADRIIAQAEGYAMERVNTAEGDASRFKSILKEYKKSKEVTRRRFYLEAMRKLIPQIKEIYIMDEDQKTVLPFMKLGKNQEAVK
ncbi:FtsH protease activity modulator HflK [Candidatus Desantisbacteria bacterium]|nr:FtsH protease activity modulator HflK [Candidatus Desantisbacteria bacterium]